MLPLDVTVPTQIQSAFEEVRKHFGRLDVVVNNAGYVLSSEIETTPIEEAKKQLEVLLWGPVQICQQVSMFKFSKERGVTMPIRCIGYQILQGC